MISMMHSDPAEPAEEEFPLPAGGRRMEMDWECVGRAFQAANVAVGWDADIVLMPEIQRVLVRFPPERVDLMIGTTDQFYDRIEAEIGTEAFRSLSIDFESIR